MNIVLTRDRGFSILLNYLCLPKFGPGRNRNDILELYLKYTSLITSSSARRIYLKLIEVVAYYPEQPRRWKSAHINKKSREAK